jgi:hypothetical protein
MSFAYDSEHQRFPNGMEDYFEEKYQRGANKDEKRSKPPRYFTSNKPQAFIKNAVTGVPYPYVVGSKEQSLLYKLVDTTGMCDPGGYAIKTRNNLPNPDTNHLFYDSPEQCMSHLHLTLNPTEVALWHERHQNSL